MNTKMTGLRWFCALDKSSLSIGRVKFIEDNKKALLHCGGNFLMFIIHEGAAALSPSRNERRESEKR